MVVHAVLINCKVMLERSSNIYGECSIYNHLKVE